MLRAAVVRLAVSFALSSSALCFAQGTCPTANSTKTSVIPGRSGNLICLVPQEFGPGGMVGTDHGGPLFSTQQFSHAAHFTNSALQSFTALNTEIGSQITQLPITSPISGFVFSFNPQLGVVSRQTEGFGPILTERPDTIGRHKLFLGVSYQYFNFDKADGVNLRSFGAVFQHEPEPELCPNPNITCGPDGEPTFQHDVIATQNRVDLKVHQVVGVATFGITSRFDLSIAVPILDVRTDIFSDAVIDSFETSTDKPACCVHQFDPANGQIGTHEDFLASNHASFADQKSATGIGDVTIRGKYQVIKGEKVGLALGADLHLPTGDERNFLGSGTWGVRPFVTVGYQARISPHATFGYQRNGDSVLSGDISTDTSEHLPDVLTYTAGVDAGISRRLSVSSDFIGQSLVSARRIIGTSFTDFGGTVHSNLTSSTATLNQAYISAGGKVNPVGRLLIIANVLFQVNDAGLHSKPVPLIGLSYSF